MKDRFGRFCETDIPQLLIKNITPFIFGVGVGRWAYFGDGAQPAMEAFGWRQKLLIDYFKLVSDNFKKPDKIYK